MLTESMLIGLPMADDVILSHARLPSHVAHQLFFWFEFHKNSVMINLLVLDMFCLCHRLSHLLPLLCFASLIYVQCCSIANKNITRFSSVFFLSLTLRSH